MGKAIGGGQLLQEFKPKRMGGTIHEDRRGVHEPSLSTLEMSEDDLQRAVATYLDYANLDWFHTPNEAKRSLRLGAKLKKNGLKAGVPDCMIINPTRTKHLGLAIELKIKPNKPTPSQLEWKSKLEANGWAWECAYDLDQVINIVKKYYHR
jgi:hypothetical protein